MIIIALWDQQDDTGEQLQETCVQNKPTLSVSPSRCAIKTQGHSHTLARLFKQLFCNNFFFKYKVAFKSFEKAKHHVSPPCVNPSL